METDLTPIDIIRELSPIQPKTQILKDIKNSNSWIPTLKESSNQLDPNCIIQINKRLVRVEYPGEVKNLDRAIETLGGMESIELSVAKHQRKLELCFHPKNIYNKACIAEKDFKPGILLKVKNSRNENKEKYDYEVDGVSVINFSFGKLCDFQYLPLVTEEPETKSSEAENILEKILPSQLPPRDWLTSEDSKNMLSFLLPTYFTHFYQTQTKVPTENVDKAEQKAKVKSADSTVRSREQKSICRIFRKNTKMSAILLNFTDPEVPTSASEFHFRLVKNRNLESKFERVKQLFEERPIWTKSAVRYITSLTDEHCKVVLPAVAYYFKTGPWSRTWVRYGYDPRKDPKARIYQTLDYRIRTADSSKLKVTSKRNYITKTTQFVPALQTRISLKHDMSTKPKSELDERHYILRPNTIPPARQMFYQLCDLLLPDIQDMIGRLPENAGSFCHPKCGFLPENFIEESRRCVNEHVLEAVQKELLEDKKIMEKDRETKQKEKGGGLQFDYYNRMLSNIKKGLYGVQDQKDVHAKLANPDELIDLSSDEDSEYTVGEIIQNAIPEMLDEGNSEEEESDEGEIDLEAAQEINEMLSQFNEKI